MYNERFIDIKVRDVERTATIEFFQADFSISMNVGRLINITLEEENLLLFQFEKGEIRFELSIEELNNYLKRPKNQ